MVIDFILKAVGGEDYKIKSYCSEFMWINT